MFTHKSSQAAQYLTFRLDNAHEISLTPDHYILVNASSSPHVSLGTSKIVEAADVAIGDKLITTDHAQLVWGKVLSISKQLQPGLYNPHTLSGTILVNNIAALTFPNTLPPSITAHTLATFPAWLLYNLLPSKGLRVIVNDLLLSGYFRFMSLSRPLQAILSLIVPLTK